MLSFESICGPALKLPHLCAPLDGQARFQGRQTDRTSRVGRETESSKNVAAVQSVVGVVVVVADCGTKVQPWGGEQAKRGGTLFHLPAGGGHSQCGQAGGRGGEGRGGLT